VRGHLHDTALQILEFIAGDGLRHGPLSPAKIAHLAGRRRRPPARGWLDAAGDPATCD